MLRKTIQDQRGFDWITFAIYFSLVIVGTISLYSVLYIEENPYLFFDISNPFGKYSIIVAISLLLFVISYSIDWKFWNTFAYPIYGFSILLLILVLIFGADIKGARSWFNIFGFSFQPSEFGKFGTALALSAYLSHYKNDLRNVNSVLRASGIVVLPMLLILLQPDAGSAIVYISLLILFYRAGFTPLFYIIAGILAIIFVLTLLYNPEVVILGSTIIALFFFTFLYSKNKYWYILVIVATIAGIYFYRDDYRYLVIAALVFGLIVTAFLNWLKNRENSVVILPMTIMTIVFLAFATNYTFYSILKPHQQDRINVWLKPEKSDPRGALYNVLQSKMAIGSGGISGKGFLEGKMTHLDFVPEQSTDFIFSSIGEEQGFIGVTSIIILFLLFLLRLIIIAERGKKGFVTYFAYAFAGYIFIHFFMNIGMNMGLVPVVGIPLPFISKGGSSLMVFSIMMGALLKMDAERNIR